MLRRGMKMTSVAGVALMLLVARKAAVVRSRTDTAGEALLFSLHWYFTLIPNSLGLLLYHVDWRRGTERVLLMDKR